MENVEKLIACWISEDQERLGEYIKLVSGGESEAQIYRDMREHLEHSLPKLKSPWRDLILHALRHADWENIAIEITDRRRQDTGEDAWVFVNRRK